MTLRPGRLLAGALLTSALALPATAQAAPVTVDLRVEGATRTLYQGPATADAIASIAFPSSGGAHPCNVRDNTNVPADPVAPTPFGALVSGAQAAGIALDAGWSTFGGIGDFFVTSVGGDAQTGSAYWGFAVNYQEAMVGSCQIPLNGGERVLFAYDYFNQNELLTLSGPAVMNVGEYAQFAVRNGRNNVGVTGASVAGTTTQDGLASVSFTGAGIHDLQATKAGALRSNIVRVCVHDGNDGNCGFPDHRGQGGSPTPTPPAPDAPPAPVTPVAPQPAPVTPAPATPPAASVSGIRDGRTFTARRAPRELRGTVSATAGIGQVELRLKRRADKRCWSFDGASERFRSRGCRKAASWFAIGNDASWSYLLPERLEAGRYVLSVRATDPAGTAGTTERVTFRVA